MQVFEVVINAEGGEVSEPLRLESPSLPMALIVADINLTGGTAEIWHDGGRVARVRKRPGHQQSYWELV